MIHTLHTNDSHNDVSVCLVLKRKQSFYTLMHTLYYY